MKDNNLPDGWSTLRLGDIGETVIGLTYSPTDVVEEGGIPVLRSSNILNGRIALDDLVRVSSNIPDKLILKDGDILICARNGSRRLIGKNARIDKKNVGKSFGAFMCVYRSSSSDYISLLFQSSLFTRQVARDLGPTINQVTTGNLNNFRFPFPDSKEQERIVGLLDVWGKYLDILNRKIRGKRAQKLYLAQTLLTGELRLRSFKDKWQHSRLGDMSTMSSGGTPPSKVADYYGGSIPWVSIADMTDQGKYIQNTRKNLTDSGAANSAAKIYPRGTILYAMYASIGECSIATKPMTSSQAILGIITDTEQLDPMFLYHYLVLMKKHIRLQGQQGTQSNLNAQIVRNFKITFPGQDEQKAIAKLLDHLDEELTVLEVKRALVTNQKRYLLNNLITGKIRTPENLIISDKELHHA